MTIHGLHPTNFCPATPTALAPPAAVDNGLRPAAEASVTTVSAAHGHRHQRRRQLLQRHGWIDAQGKVDRTKAWPALPSLPDGVAQQVSRWLRDPIVMMARSEAFRIFLPLGLASLFEPLDRLAADKQLTTGPIYLLGGYLLRHMLEDRQFQRSLLENLGFTRQEIDEVWLPDLGANRLPEPFDLDIQYWLPIDIKNKRQVTAFKEVTHEHLKHFADYSNLQGLTDAERIYCVQQNAFEKYQPITEDSLYYQTMTIRLKEPQKPLFLEYMLFAKDTEPDCYFVRKSLRCDLRPLWEAFKGEQAAPPLQLSCFNSRDPLDIYQGLLDQYLGYERTLDPDGLVLRQQARAIYDATQEYCVDDALIASFRKSVAALTPPSSKGATNGSGLAALLSEIQRLHNNHQAHFPDGAFTLLLQMQQACGPSLSDEQQAILWQPQAYAGIHSGRRDNPFVAALSKPSSTLAGALFQIQQRSPLNHEWLEAVLGSFLLLYTAKDYNPNPVQWVIDGDGRPAALWQLARDTTSGTYTTLQLAIDPAAALLKLQRLCAAMADDGPHAALAAMFDLLMARAAPLFQGEGNAFPEGVAPPALRQAALACLETSSAPLRLLAARLFIKAWLADPSVPATTDCLSRLHLLTALLPATEAKLLLQHLPKLLKAPPCNFSRSTVDSLLSPFTTSSKGVAANAPALWEWAALLARLYDPQPTQAAVASGVKLPDQPISHSAYERLCEICAMRPDKTLTLIRQYTRTGRPTVAQHADLVKRLLAQQQALSLPQDKRLLSHMMLDLFERAGDVRQPMAPAETAQLLRLAQDLSEGGECWSSLMLLWVGADSGYLKKNDPSFGDCLAAVCTRSLETFSPSIIAQGWMHIRQPVGRLASQELGLLQQLVRELLAERHPAATVEAVMLCEIASKHNPQGDAPWPDLAAAASTQLMDMLPKEEALDILQKRTHLPKSDNIRLDLLERALRDAISQGKWTQVRGLLKEVKELPKPCSAQQQRCYQAVCRMLPQEQLVTLLDFIPLATVPPLDTVKKLLAAVDGDGGLRARIWSFILPLIGKETPHEVIAAVRGHLLDHLPTANLSKSASKHLAAATSWLLQFQGDPAPAPAETTARCPAAADDSWRLLRALPTQTAQKALEALDDAAVLQSFTDRLDDQTRADAVLKAESQLMLAYCKAKRLLPAPTTDPFYHKLFALLQQRQQWSLLRPWASWLFNERPAQLYAATDLPQLCARLVQKLDSKDSMALVAEAVQYHSALAQQGLIAHTGPNEWLNTLYDTLSQQDMARAVSLLEQMAPSQKGWRPALGKACSHLTGLGEGGRALKLMVAYANATPEHWAALLTAADQNKAVSGSVQKALKESQNALLKQICDSCSLEHLKGALALLPVEFATTYEVLESLMLKRFKQEGSLTPPWGPFIVELAAQAFKQPQPAKHGAQLDNIAQWVYQRRDELYAAPDGAGRPTAARAYADVRYYADYAGRVTPQATAACLAIASGTLTRCYGRIVPSAAEDAPKAILSKIGMLLQRACALEEDAFAAIKEDIDAITEVLGSHPDGIAVYNEWLNGIQKSMATHKGDDYRRRCLVLSLRWLSSLLEVVTPSSVEQRKSELADGLARLMLSADLGCEVQYLHLERCLTHPHMRHILEPAKQAFFLSKVTERGFANAAGFVNALQKRTHFYVEILRLYQHLPVLIGSPIVLETTLIKFNTTCMAQNDGLTPDDIVGFFDKLYEQVRKLASAQQTPSLVNGLPLELSVRGCQIYCLMHILPTDGNVSSTFPLYWSMNRLAQLVVSVPNAAAHTDYFMKMFKAFTEQDVSQALSNRLEQLNWGRELANLYADKGLLAIPADMRIHWLPYVPDHLFLKDEDINVTFLNALIPHLFNLIRREDSQGLLTLLRYISNSRRVLMPCASMTFSEITTQALRLFLNLSTQTGVAESAILLRELMVALQPLDLPNKWKQHPNPLMQQNLQQGNQAIAGLLVSALSHLAIRSYKQYCATKDTGQLNFLKEIIDHFNRYTQTAMRLAANAQQKSAILNMYQCEMSKMTAALKIHPYADSNVISVDKKLMEGLALCCNEVGEDATEITSFVEQHLSRF